MVIFRYDFGLIGEDISRCKFISIISMFCIYMLRDASSIREVVFRMMRESSKTNVGIRIRMVFKRYS